MKTKKETKQQKVLKALEKESKVENKIKFENCYKYLNKSNTNANFISNLIIELFKAKNETYYIYSAVLLNNLNDKLEHKSTYAKELRKYRYRITESDLAKLLESINKSLNSNFDINITIDDIKNIKALV